MTTMTAQLPQDKIPVKYNPNARGIIRAWQRLGIYAWRAVGLLNTQLVIAYYYIFSGTLFVYLELTIPQTTPFGLRTAQELWGIPPIVTILVYVTVGIIMTQPNHSPLTYMFLLLPAFFYSLTLAQISMTGAPIAWTAFVYTTSFIGIAMVSVRQRWQITQINRQFFQDAGTWLVLEKQLKQVMSERTKRDIAYVKLHEFIMRVTVDGSQSLSIEGVRLMLTYIDIFTDINPKGQSKNATDTNNNAVTSLDPTPRAG